MVAVVEDMTPTTRQPKADEWAKQVMVRRDLERDKSRQADSDEVRRFHRARADVLDELLLWASRPDATKGFAE